MSEPRFFGINQCGHDAGFACFDQAGTLLACWQHERVVRQKRVHEMDRFDEIVAKAGLDPISKNDYFFSSTHRGLSELFLRKSCNWNLSPSPLCLDLNETLAGYKLFQVSHHHSHAAASWLFRQKEVQGTSLFIALDGGGAKANTYGDCGSFGKISDSHFEEIDFRFERKRYSSFDRLARIALPTGGGMDAAGKLMGLCGYLPADSLSYLSFDPGLPDQANQRIQKEGLTPSVMSFLASIYYSYIEDVKNLIGRFIDQYPSVESVAVGGGTFLGLELNSFIAEEKKKNLIFCPGVDDSGEALGNAALGYFLINKKWPKPIATPYLQWGPREPRDQYLSPSEAAKVLKGRGVLGVLHGPAEFGPRALGNRSFLTRPTLENARLISVEIKGREFYRPVAPVVTDREFDRFFKGPKGSYMQFRNHCNPQASKLIPGVVHNDQTARCQVLSHSDHPWLYELLVECGKEFGAEVLINTSLNAKGKPICNTAADFKNEIYDSRVRLVSF